jgi:hypothetical protein
MSSSNEAHQALAVPGYGAGMYAPPPAVAFATPVYSGEEQKHGSPEMFASPVAVTAYAAALPVPAVAEKRRRPTAAPSSGSRSAATEMPPPLAGPGVPLGELALLVRRFEKVSNDDPRTKILYSLCFPTWEGPIPDRSAKKSLRQFSGWANPELRAQARVKLQSYASELDLMRKLAKLLDLSPEGDAAAVSARLENWLASPSLIVHAPKEESAPGPKKRKSGKRDKQKRPPNAYLVFANEKREEITRAQPDLQMMEVNRILGQLWSAVGDSERQQYVDRAAKLRDAWAIEHPEAAAQLAATTAAGSGRKRQKGASSSASAAAPAGEYDSDQMSDVAGGGNHGRATPGAASASAAPSPMPPIVDRGLALALQSAIVRLLSTADLEQFSLRALKTQLALQFSDKIVLHNAQLISDLVDDEFIKSSG